MVTIAGIEFAPIFIPWQRRMQTLAVVVFLMFFLGLPIYLPLFFYLLFTRYWWLSAAYLTYMVVDRHTPKRGGRRNLILRNWCLTKHIANYFPMKLVKTVDIDPNRNYIFAVHPHGVSAVSSVFNFGSNATGWNKVFPKLVPHLMSLNILFWTPIYREMILWMGNCSASAESFDWILSNESQGHVVAVVPGGVREVIDAIPGTLRLSLRNRKGFVRMAVKYGVPLVPVINFGENDIYYQRKRSDDDPVRRWQIKITKFIGFGAALMSGRGIFQYTFGVLPFRKPITTVVGKPFEVEKRANPTEADVAAVHQQYIDSLMELFHQNKDKYGSPGLELVID